MWLCAGKLKVKTAHFWLPSASQKRACLSSLVNYNYEEAIIVYFFAKPNVALQRQFIGQF